MATITITINTDEESISATIDGKEVEGNISSVSAYRYDDYYNKNKPKVSWSISASPESENEDVMTYTNYCSAAAESLNLPLDKVASDVANYFDKKKAR